MAALLRVSTWYGRLVLVNTGKRMFGPLGGAFMHVPGTEHVLAGMDWQADTLLGADLRGVLPQDSLREFRAWFDSGDGRESGADCLRRELAEEFVETGLDHLVDLLDGVGFVHLLTVTTPLHDNDGRRETRTFELYDLDSMPRSRALRNELVNLAGDPLTSKIITVTRSQVRRGRVDGVLIGSQSRYIAAL